MFKKLSLVCLIATGCAYQSAYAVPCGQEHRISSGDNLSTLSENPIHYDDQKFWSVLYQANKDRIGNNPNLIFPGVLLRIPCLDEKGNILPGQFDEAGNPIAGAFDGSHDHSNDEAKEADTMASTEETAVANTEEMIVEETMVEETMAEEIKVEESASTDSGTQTAVAAAETARSIRLLTGDDYGLSADKSISNGRLVSKIMDAALTEDGEKNHQINFVNDWSAHLNPLLSSQAFDIGFPWLKPDCENNATDKRCADFMYSDPVFEIWMVLFVNASSPIKFEEDGDLVGKKLCRPSGYETNDLDENDRNWLAESKITLEQPASVQQCFRLLLNNEVDAVTVNEFTGRSVLKSLNVEDKVDVIDSRPVSIRNLYAIVNKQHPQAQMLLDEVNNGLKAIQASGKYQEILDGAK